MTATKHFTRVARDHICWQPREKRFKRIFMSPMTMTRGRRGTAIEKCTTQIISKI